MEIVKAVAARSDLNRDEKSRAAIVLRFITPFSANDRSKVDDNLFQRFSAREP